MSKFSALTPTFRVSAVTIAIGRSRGYRRHVIRRGWSFRSCRCRRITRIRLGGHRRRRRAALGPVGLERQRVAVVVAVAGAGVVVVDAESCLVHLLVVGLVTSIECLSISSAMTDSHQCDQVACRMIFTTFDVVWFIHSM